MEYFWNGFEKRAGVWQGIKDWGKSTLGKIKSSKTVAAATEEAPGLLDKARKVVSDHPLTTLGVGAGAGALGGHLLSSSRNNREG